MKKRAFSLVEILVVVVIIGILATIGLPYFQNLVESSKEKSCETNLLTLQKAVEIYTMEHDNVPASLSQLKDKDIQRAYASVMSGKDAWQRRLAYFLVEGPQWGIAYAQTSFGMPHLRCPNNPDTSSTQISYGLNSALSGMTSILYKNLLGDVVIVADSVSTTFSYAGAGGGTSSGGCSWTSVPSNRFHKKFGLLGRKEMRLLGATKDGRRGYFNNTKFSPNPNFN